MVPTAQVHITCMYAIDELKYPEVELVQGFVDAEHPLLHLNQPKQITENKKNDASHISNVVFGRFWRNELGLTKAYGQRKNILQKHWLEVAIRKLTVTSANVESFINAVRGLALVCCFSLVFTYGNKDMHFQLGVKTKKLKKYLGYKFQA